MKKIFLLTILSLFSLAVTAQNLCNANFTFSVSGSTVDFTNTSTSSGGFPGYEWDFGDGNISTLTDPTHSYASPGTYTVCLLMTSNDSIGGFCMSNICHDVTVSQDSTGGGCIATANFSTTINGLNVQFNDLSIGSVVYYDWNFGDGNYSNASNPNHTYGAPGTYTACLLVEAYDSISGNWCSDMYCEPITVPEDSTSGGCDVTANFNATANALNVQFNDLSIGSPWYYTWSFGDGSFSNLSNPNYTYAAPGTYTVCLTVEAYDSLVGLFCYDSICWPVTVFQDSLDSSTGLFNQYLETFSLYPNPASDAINLRFDGSTKQAYAHITDMVGREMQEINITSEITEIEVSQLPSGVYLIHIFDSNHKVIGCRRFIRK